MTQQHPGPGDLRADEPAAVAGLARRVVEAYQGADEHLRHAVQDSLQAGMPWSVLLAEELAATPAVPAGVEEDRTGDGG